MIDQRNKNTMVVTGTPTLTAGALSLDTNQGLTFNGPTSFYQATDSASLSITSSLSLEFFFKFASLPGATRDIVSKASSYAAQLNTSGKLLFKVDNGASTVTVTSNATLSTNTYYHIVCVLNQEYAGAEEFGKTSAGSLWTTLDDDNGNNKFVSMYTLPEPAILRTVQLQVEYVDELWDVNVRGVVYTDNGSGVPDDLVTQSATTSYTSATMGFRDGLYRGFELIPVVVPAGDYHIGGITDTDTHGGPNKAVLRWSRESTGGTSSFRPDSVSGASDPFGSVVVSNSSQYAAYVEYDAIVRTGLEGKAAVYINGALDNSASYTAGIADNSNALQISPSAAFSVDEVSVWNRVLTPLEVATHYLAR